MESLGAGVRSLPPATIRTANVISSRRSGCSHWSVPGGQLRRIDDLRGRPWPVRGSSRGGYPALAWVAGERLGGGVELLARDVGVAAHRREVCMSEVLGDQPGIACGLAQPRRGGVAQRMRGHVL